MSSFVYCLKAFTGAGNRLLWRDRLVLHVSLAESYATTLCVMIRAGEWSSDTAGACGQWARDWPPHLPPGCSWHQVPLSFMPCQLLTFPSAHFAICTLCHLHTESTAVLIMLTLACISRGSHQLHAALRD